MKSAGHNLISDIYRWAGSLKDEIWVFQDGCWMKDQALWAAIRSASWDDMVLEKEFLEGLRRDTRTFFENSKIYHELGVVWKRGLLLLGPPGNGKTETIKVLLKESGQAALYVKSFSTPAGPEAGVRSIFNHARENAPCILVIEDLDSLVTPNVRSFFLNELDGLGQNEGILTIATTNHPERIDDAILNRPSRFDVKYDFALPTEALRNAYALKWIRKIASLSTSAETQADSGSKTTVTFEKDEMELAEEVAKKTEGWSFAFLKELYVSSYFASTFMLVLNFSCLSFFRFISFLLRLAHDKAHSLAQGKTPTCSTTADADLMEQITSLSSQILPTNTSADGATAGEHTGSSGNMAMGAGMMGHMYAMPAFRRPAQSLFYPSGNF
ncbi:P-loop containing nucleoside triphosphate hydrolase protein [Phellopilus nigrolimitatus]|nr:P-loop containing nucleoside triphosphate hydrolase protein [Phellopilus nigrolimitatus]